MEPQAAESFDFDRPPQKLVQPHRWVQVSAVVAGVHACEHDLAEAGLDQKADPGEDGLRRHAPAVAADPRDAAIGAAQVAAILYLEEGAGAVPRAEARIAASSGSEAPQ